jgi:crotonobetaine/carnitine-CoA ligase
MREMYGSEPDRIPVPHVVVARSPQPVPGALHFETELESRPDRLAGPPPLSPDDPAMLLFTSGTTAVPKAVLLTHANLVFSGDYVDWQAGIGPDDRLATTMPACHVNFLLNGLMPVLAAGAALVAIEGFHPSTFWQRVRAHRATVVQAIAMMVRTMLLQPETAGDRNEQVREILYYLPITDEQKQRFEQRFGGRILNSYGNSECLVGAITDPPAGERRWPSIGRVGPGYQARIAGPDGRELPPGAEGEIQLRGVPGRTLMKEYYQDPQATAALYDPDGWMHTGDLGHVDADGWFYFHDRMSLLIKRSGENVSPAEVEAVLTGHPQIAEATVVGVPDPIHDQQVKAVVVPVPGATLTAEDVQLYCREHLAGYKVPAVVELVAAVPYTPSFKVARTAAGAPHGKAQP